MLPLGDSDAVAVGEPVVAIGNPLGFDFSLSSGIVSAVDRQLEAPNGATIYNGIQTDAAINPGNSGGPLINARGEVIGINEQIASNNQTGTAGNDGLGFAVPINTAKRVMEQLRDTGTAQAAWLGIGMANLTPDVAATLDYKVDRGAIVTEVHRRQPGRQGRHHRPAPSTTTILGIHYPKGSDVIVAIDGNECHRRRRRASTSSPSTSPATRSTSRPARQRLQDVKVTSPHAPKNLRPDRARSSRSAPSPTGADPRPTLLRERRGGLTAAPPRHFSFRANSWPN